MTVYQQSLVCSVTEKIHGKVVDYNNSHMPISTFPFFTLQLTFFRHFLLSLFMVVVFTKSQKVVHERMFKATYI